MFIEENLRDIVNDDKLLQRHIRCCSILVLKYRFLEKKVDLNGPIRGHLAYLAGANIRKEQHVYDSFLQCESFHILYERFLIFIRKMQIPTN